MKEFLVKNGSTWNVVKESPLHAHILEYFHTTWGTRRNGRYPPIFPGPQPISIERIHFKTLTKSPYVVCEKSDGVRNALVCTEFNGKKVAVLINRALDMQFLNMSFSKNAQKGSILDGELVGNQFMIYDAVAVYGVNIMQNNLMERLLQATRFVKGTMRLAKDPVKISMKTFFPLQDFKTFQKEYLPKLDYKTDGLVFTPVSDPVRIGTHETMFKWKPRDMNTIDFQVKWRGNKWGLYIQEKGSLIFESEITPDMVEESFADWLVEDAIVECQYMIDSTPIWWKPIGIRTDKTYPNNRRTFYRTMVNVKEDIKIQEFASLYKTK
jgi:hypothetical protein